MLQCVGFRHGTTASTYNSKYLHSGKQFSHVGMPFLVHCLGEKKPQNNKTKEPNPLPCISLQAFCMAACECNIWMHSQQWSPQSVRLLKAALPEEKIPFQTDRRESMEENVSVYVVLLKLAKSDLRNFSVVLKDRSRFNQSPLRYVNY